MTENTNKEESVQHNRCNTEMLNTNVELKNLIFFYSRINDNSP